MRAILPLLAVSSLFPAALPVLAGEVHSGKNPPAALLPDNPAPASRFHFRLSAGAASRSVGAVEFDSGSRSGGEALPFPSTALRGLRSTAGSVSHYADRRYDDGYVNQDQGTAEDGSTWFWGYDHASQLSTGSGGGGSSTVSFHGAADSIQNESRRFSDRDPGSWSADHDGTVPVIQLDWTYDVLPQLSVGASLQYSWLGLDGSRSFGNFSATRVRTSQDMTLTDTYDTSGIVIPSAPWQGTLAGPGPLINNLPTARNVSKGGILDSSRTTYFNQVRESLDVKLHTLAFGPTVAARLGPVDLALGTGLALNIANWDASHRETLYVRNGSQDAKIYKRWNDHASGTKVLPGAYLQAAATVALTNRLSLTAFGNYDWSQALTAQAGPSRFHLDPTGWMAGGMLGWNF